MMISLPFPLRHKILLFHSQKKQIPDAIFAHVVKLITWYLQMRTQSTDQRFKSPLDSQQLHLQLEAIGTSKTCHFKLPKSLGNFFYKFSVVIHFWVH